jgi:hypothetical protein
MGSFLPLLPFSHGAIKTGKSLVFKEKRMNNGGWPGSRDECAQPGEAIRREDLQKVRKSWHGRPKSIIIERN